MKTTTTMKIRRIKLFLLLFVIITFNNMHAAETSKELPKLTQKQMQEDIAFLVKTLKDVNPHLAIRELVTGSPLRAEIDSLAASSKNLETFEDFYSLGSKILALCQDAHTRFRSVDPEDIENNPYISQEGINITDICEGKYRSSRLLPSMRYINGEYFFYDNIYCVKNENIKSFKDIIKSKKELIYPACAKVLTIDNIPIAKYINEINWKKDYFVRWDVGKKTYYTNRIYPPNDNSVITYQYNGTIKTTSDNIECDMTFINGSPCEDIWDEKVLWFKEGNILYIYIPEMDYSKIDFYVKQIKKYKRKPIDKVVIDVRGNGGGDDLVWLNVLHEIIDTTIFFNSKLYMKDDELLIDYYKKVYKLDISSNPRKIINGESFIENISVSDTLPPSPTSLRYKGKIYIIADRDVFSSTLAFLAVCNRDNRFVTVGEPSGYILGRSATPLFLSLPNSKLIFWVVPCLDMTNVKSFEDCYDHKRDILIENPECNFQYHKECFGKDYLYNHDPYFKKILEQK